MRPYFDSWERAEQLHKLAEAWVGTPFVPFASIRGAGVDCVNLCAELLQASGFPIAKNTWPRYVMDGGKHNRESQLCTWLSCHDRFSLVSGRDYHAAIALPGDVLCFQMGRSAHHAGLLVTGAKFIHCLFGHQVMFATLSDLTFNRRLIAVYRPMEVA